MLYLATVTVHQSSCPDHTIEAGRRLAATLGPGSAVALTGDLGAGKTHFVRGLVTGWGGTDDATSPTFALLHEYTTPRGPVFHLDLYRAESAAGVWAAVHDELDAPHGMVVVEWADRFPQLLPTGAVQVAIRFTGDECRTIEIQP